MTKDEALKLALEALGLAKSSHNMVLTSDPPQSAWRYHNVDMKLREAITVIREALAQPEQEPVAWLIWLHGPAGHFDHKQFAEMEFERRNKEYPDPDRKLLPLYTTPPQRKPLTDEEIFSIWRKHTDLDAVRHTPYEDDGIGFARAIEAAHGIKE